MARNGNHVSHNEPHQPHRRAAHRRRVRAVRARVRSLAYWPHLAKTRVANSAKPYNNIDPRRYTEGVIEALRAEGKEDVARKIERCRNAHHNGLETFPIFAAGALAAHVTGVNPRTAAALATIFLASRTSFNLAYIYGTDTKTSVLRSLSFFVSMGASVALMVLAARR